MGTIPSKSEAHPSDSPLDVQLSTGSELVRQAGNEAGHFWAVLTDTQKHSGKKSAALCRQLPEPVWKEISPHIFGIPLLKFFNKETDDAKISVSSPSWLLP